MKKPEPGDRPRALLNFVQEEKGSFRQGLPPVTHPKRQEEFLWRLHSFDQAEIFAENET